MVRNFGVEGYVSNQELLQLSKHLKTNQPPDIVVFYDGVNDAAAAGASAGAPSAHFYLGTIKSRVEGTFSGRLDFVREAYTMQVLEALRGRSHSLRLSELPAGQMQQKATAVLDNFEANLRLAQAFAKTFDFELFWFWQPSLYYGHKTRVPFEEHVFEVNASDENKRWSAVIAKVYQEAERRATQNGDFIFLGSIFDYVTEPLYIDEAHLGPRGNELIAQYIARHLQNHSQIYTNTPRQY